MISIVIGQPLVRCKALQNLHVIVHDSNLMKEELLGSPSDAKRQKLWPAANAVLFPNSNLPGQVTPNGSCRLPACDCESPGCFRG